jgi:hypothetical protein
VNPNAEAPATSIAATRNARQAIRATRIVFRRYPPGPTTTRRQPTGPAGRHAAIVLLLATLVLGSGAAGRADRPPVQLGVFGSAERFGAETGQRTTVRHVIMSWTQVGSIPQLLRQMAPVPMLGITTEGASITPFDIAQGRGDEFLISLNAALAEYGRLAYVRPLPEMNGHWSGYSAFTASGAAKGAPYSTAAFRKAFARIYLFVHGGTARRLTARLRRLGLPGVTRDLPPTAARVVWNPQGYGSPDIPENTAQAYYPGDRYVDVVANDLYDQRFNAAWDANERLYAAHPRKPYAIAEWGLWGIDDPAFVERMAAFARTHPRLEFLAYYSGRPGSPWDLATKPRSRAVYRRLITPLG